MNESMFENIPEDDITQLVSLAEQGAWEEVDIILPDLSQKPEVHKWATENVLHSESEKRDLAASIIEASNLELTEDNITDVVTLMRTTDEENPYPTFRAACALAKKLDQIGDDESLKNEVRETIKMFENDADVSELAKSYLSEYF